MNPSIRKELRLLFPAWVVALVVATAPVWVERDYENVAMFLYGASALFLGLASFGQEMTFGTFGLLLVQPEQRRRWWSIKAGLSAVALLSALSVEDLSWLIRGSSGGSTDLRYVLGACAITTVVAYAGGLWAALLLREMIGAFFVSFLTPLAALWAVFFFFSHWIQTEHQADTAVYSVLSVYSVAGFWFGRRLFLRAQDIPWTGGMRALPAAWSAPARWLSIGFPQKCSPWRAFVRKEFQQQESALALVIFLALGHLAAIAARHFYPLHSSGVRGFLDAVWIFWAIIPLASGSVAVAEERRLRTHEGELCVPFSVRNQFVIKLAMALVVGVGLGGAVPYLLEGGARAMGLANDVDTWALHRVLLVGATGIALLSFYASTLTNRVVPALATVVCLVIGMAGALGMAPGLFGPVSFWHRTIFICLEWPVMTLAFIWLAYRNYHSVRVGWRIWLGNAGCLVAVFASVAVLAGGIYNRAWELVMPLEPQHGAAKITGPGPATIVNFSHGVEVLLPDGRLWIGEQPSNSYPAVSGAFGPGSDWVSLAATRQGAAAIKSDGSLWNVSDFAHLSQIGTNSDWKKVAGSWNIFYALKRDGTLWEWGHVPGPFFGGYRVRSAPDISNPERVGDGSEWVDIFAPHEGVHLKGVKSDGTIWELMDVPERNPQAMQLHFLNEFGPLKLGLAGTNWTSLETWGVLDSGLALGIRSDGTLWFAGDFPGANIGAPPEFFGEAPHARYEGRPVRVGDKSDWVQFTASGVHMVGLESNGTLSVTESSNLRTWHPSKYRDWIGAAAEFQGVWALAANGTLDCWEENMEDARNDAVPIFERRPFLRVTRGPVVAVNIFDSH